MRKYSRASTSRSNGTREAAGGDLKTFPISFSITPAGALYLLLLLPFSLAAIRTGNNLLVIVLATMLAVVPVSGFVSRGSLKRLSLSLEVPEHVHAGERVILRITVVNGKRLAPSFFLRVEGPGGRTEGPQTGRLRTPFPRFRKRKAPEAAPARSILDREVYFPIVPPGESRTALLPRSFPRRGRYTLEGFRVSSRFPFGFFERGELVRAEGEVVVYPSPRAVSPFFRLLPFLPGALESARPGPGESLLAIRRHREGESARIIDWKATAKTLRLMAREHARDEDSRFCLILDTRTRAPGDPDEDFERAVSMAAGIATHFIGEGAAIAFLAPRAYLPPGGDARHLDRILRTLAVIHREEAPPTDTPLWDPRAFRAAAGPMELRAIFSDKNYKIILTPHPREAFPAALRRSAHVIPFEEL